MDGQGPRLDGLNSLPAAFGFAGAGHDVAQPGGLVLVLVGMHGRRAARRGGGREALVEEAQVLGLVAIVGIDGLRDMDQFTKQGMSDRRLEQVDRRLLTQRSEHRCARARPSAF